MNYLMRDRIFSEFFLFLNFQISDDKITNLNSISEFKFWFPAFVFWKKGKENCRFFYRIHIFSSNFSIMIIINLFWLLFTIIFENESTRRQLRLKMPPGNLPLCVFTFKFFSSAILGAITTRKVQLDVTTGKLSKNKYF